MIMHMEALDHSYSTNMNADCLGAPLFSSVTYPDHYDSGNCSPMDSPHKQSYKRTPSSSSFGSDSLYSSGGDSLFASSVSSRSDSMYDSSKSDQDRTLYNRTASHCSGYSGSDSPYVDSASDLSSFSSLSISSGDYPSSSTDSFSSPLSIGNHNTNNISSRPRQRKLASQTSNKNSASNVLGKVPRRSSAPAKSSNADSGSRKDSFIYDVQLDSDNVLLFVPDLDLVKSHLMFAVREEVDVLKEKIGELMDRISTLEYENGVLKQYATPEALHLLNNNPNSHQ